MHRTARLPGGLLREGLRDGGRLLYPPGQDPQAQVQGHPRPQRRVRHGRGGQRVAEANKRRKNKATKQSGVIINNY